MSKEEKERRIISAPFPISGAAWKIAERELFLRRAPEEEAKARIEKEAGIMMDHYRPIHTLTFGLSTKLASYLCVDPFYFRAGLLLGFRAHRAEASLRQGLLPEVELQTVRGFLKALNYCENPTLSQQINMGVQQQKILDRFKAVEAQTWNTLKRNTYEKESMREGLLYGVVDMNTLFRRQAGQ